LPHAENSPVFLSLLKSQKELNNSQFDIRLTCGRGTVLGSGQGGFIGLDGVRVHS
jgi:hypothetical protein